MYTLTEEQIVDMVNKQLESQIQKVVTARVQSAVDKRLNPIIDNVLGFNGNSHKQVLKGMLHEKLNRKFNTYLEENQLTDLIDKQELNEMVANMIKEQVLMKLNDTDFTY